MPIKERAEYLLSITIESKAEVTTQIALADLNFSVERGQIIALKGELVQ